MFARTERSRQSLVLLAARSLVTHVNVLSRARQVLRVTMLVLVSFNCFQSLFPTHIFLFQRGPQKQPGPSVRGLTPQDICGTYSLHQYIKTPPKEQQLEGYACFEREMAWALPLTQRAFSWARIVPSHSFSCQYLDNGKIPPRTQALVPNR
jgi:hypothetical protein